jgi:hypothetical protein
MVLKRIFEKKWGESAVLLIRPKCILRSKNSAVKASKNELTG